MTTKRLVLALNMLLVLPGLALSAERTVIVGFRQWPGRSEQSMVYQASGAIRRSHHLIPAMTVTLPEEKIEELKNDSRIAYVEENAVFTVAGQPLTEEDLETMRHGDRPQAQNAPNETAQPALTPEEEVEELRRTGRISYFGANGVYVPATDPLTAEEVERLRARAPAAYMDHFGTYSMAADPASGMDRENRPPVPAGRIGAGAATAGATPAGLAGNAGRMPPPAGAPRSIGEREIAPPSLSYFNVEGTGNAPSVGIHGYVRRNAMPPASPRAYARREIARPRNNGGSANAPRYGGYEEVAAPPATEASRQPASEMQTASLGQDALYSYSGLTLTGTELENAWGVAHISADVAHAAGNKGAGITIAVLDTGVDYNHPDLDGNYGGGYDFISSPNDADPMDDNFFGHGTHVAGILAAEENGTGVIGVAPEATILAVKVLDGAGFGNSDAIVAGIEWAVANGADIINMSIQGPHDQAVEAACQAAYNAGVLLVAAGGNSHTGGAPVTYPAAYSTVIAVTALDSTDTPGYFSPMDNLIELAAPGVNIISTVKDGEYDSIDGTSQAAPHVSGTAALFMAVNTEDRTGDGFVDQEDVRRLLKLTATDLGDTGPDAIYGSGLVSAALAYDGAVIDDGGDDGGDGGDPAGYTVTESSGATIVSETGTTDTFDVVLDTQPQTDVVIAVVSDDTGEATVDQASLTFTPSNWNVPQTVTVTGVDDAIEDGDQMTTITLAIDQANSDDAFDSLSDQTVSVTNADDGNDGGDDGGTGGGDDGGTGGGDDGGTGGGGDGGTGGGDDGGTGGGDDGGDGAGDSTAQVHYVHDIIHGILQGRIPEAVHASIHDIIFQVHHQVISNQIYETLRGIYGWED